MYKQKTNKIRIKFIDFVYFLLKIRNFFYISARGMKNSLCKAKFF